MSKVFANSLSFHYWRVGEGPDVIMLHGLSGNLAVWHLKMVPMLRQNYRITTFDLRGHGRSDMPPRGYTTGDMAEDLRGIMDALDIEYAHLVGHSMGADIALNFALRYPERTDRLVLVEAGLPALVGLRKGKDWEGWAYWAKLLEEFSGVKVPREKWHDVDYMLRESLKVRIVYGPARGRPRKTDRMRQLLDTTTLVEDYEVVGDLTLDNVSTIPHPKLLVYDSGSPYMGTYEILCEIAQNYTPLVLPPSEHRHFGPLEQPELLVEHIAAFLKPDLPDSPSPEEA